MEENKYDDLLARKEFIDKKISENKKHIEKLKEENKNFRVKIDEYDIIRKNKAYRDDITKARKRFSNYAMMAKLKRKNKRLEKEKSTVVTTSQIIYRFFTRN